MPTTSEKYHQEGVKLFRAGDYEEAVQQLELALENESEAGHQAEIYNDLGVIYKELDDFDAAGHAFDEAMSRFVQLADKKGQGQTLGNRAAAYQSAGEFDLAVDTYKQAAIGAYEEGVENMPEHSVKRKIVQKLLKVPGSMLAGKIKPDQTEADDE
jgi:Flp pilus assembly protein TadD